MSVQARETAQIIDLYPKREDFRAEVLRGLQLPRKRLPPKLFYDKRGSSLFETICNQPEYYPTRVELQILRQYAGELAAAIDEHSALFEFGAGSAIKTRLLLRALEKSGRLPRVYIPVDVSREMLLESAEGIHRRFPEVSVLPVCADYTRTLRIPASYLLGASSRVAFFPGSTLGNMEPHEAISFLRNVGRTLKPAGKILVGIDLQKDPRVLVAAYNDAAGVTAAFNLNVLERIRQEFGAQIDLDRFGHRAIYNAEEGRVEMHLVSLGEQILSIGGRRFGFRRGETIHTESSYKYTLEGFSRLARASGYSVARVWSDERRYFAIILLEVLPVASLQPGLAHVA
jgi:dimethylhistidine N-methyltransferase